MALCFIILAIADVMSFVFIGYLIAPRVGEFLGKILVVQVMGDIYGKKVQSVTTVCAIIRTIGTLAIQFSVLSNILIYFFDISSHYALLITAAVIIFILQ